jgi:1-deoxy-D-xylulose 5-phosphate reductoisomerase
MTIKQRFFTVVQALHFWDSQQLMFKELKRERIKYLKLHDYYISYL